MMQIDDSDLTQQALQLQNLKIESTMKLVKAKEEELNKAEELPTKADFDLWSKKFNLEPRRALSDEEQFLR